MIEDSGSAEEGNDLAVRRKIRRVMKPDDNDESYDVNAVSDKEETK